jgi:chromosomal replication initiation ATPase DnaA
MSKTWKKCLETLKDTVPVGQFSVWIKPLKAQEKNGTLTILAPNDSAVSYLKKNLKQKIKDVIALGSFSFTMCTAPCIKSVFPNPDPPYTMQGL